jgi:hypothetical protein
VIPCELLKRQSDGQVRALPTPGSHSSLKPSGFPRSQLKEPRGSAMTLSLINKYGGLEVSEARRLKGLEDENRRLKKLLAESMLDNAALKDLLGKNG